MSESQRVVDNAALGGAMASNANAKGRLEKLSAVLEGAKSMLIIMQNSPDPDAIAAAAALREIANDVHDISCSVAHSGTVGRAENQALLRYLALNTRPLDALELVRFDRLAMVDAQPGAGNVNFDPKVRLDVVIDHHPIRRETRSARFTDIRSRFGATSTILYEYLAEAGIDIPTPLATALVYGIRSDTQDLGRESTRADIDAFLALYPSANAKVLGRIVSAPLPRSYFASLREAISNATIHGDRVVSFLGELGSQEMIAEAADLLLRVEGMRWSVCLGVIDGWLHLSIRSVDREPHCGKIARNLAGRRGFGGGHHTLAAAQIPLPIAISNGRQVKRMVNGIVKRFLRATGGPAESTDQLCKC
jgi:nanoRNase/pAp phosphatase (c-di-AMP/oligoRNAs hydrolase)